MQKISLRLPCARGKTLSRCAFALLMALQFALSQGHAAWLPDFVAAPSHIFIYADSMADGNTYLHGIDHAVAHQECIAKIDGKCGSFQKLVVR
jgi:hypothetical protein